MKVENTTRKVGNNQNVYTYLGHSVRTSVVGKVHVVSTHVYLLAVLK